MYSHFWDLELLPPKEGDKDRLFYPVLEMPYLECVCCGEVYNNMRDFNRHYKSKHCRILPIRVADPITGKPRIAWRVYRGVINCDGMARRRASSGVV